MTRVLAGVRQQNAASSLPPILDEEQNDQANGFDLSGFQV